MTSRRDFLKLSTLMSAIGFAAPSALFSNKAFAGSAVLNSRQIPQFVEPLPNPLAPSFIVQPDSGTSYTLRIKEFTQNLGLVSSNNKPLSTLVWGYGTNTRAATYPGPTFEVQQGTSIDVTYKNDLIDPATGAPIPHRMPIDTTLDWTNPGAIGGLTPVPVANHLHGGDSAYLSDGLPDAWETPNGQMGRLFSRAYVYENLQEAGHLWYHDHARGITRNNVYMGLAGLYFIRDANENALRDSGVLPKYPYEVPMVIQDRQFNTDGSLFYPSSSTGNAPNPTHLPEFFGDVILVNGKSWPKLDVEPRKYRFRMLNGSDSRFYDLRILGPKGQVIPLMVIGNELGFLNKPATPDLNNVLNAIVSPPNILPIGPGERYDVIVDFSGLPVGTRVQLKNTARSPYPNGKVPITDITDRVMAFNVVPLNSAVPNATVDFNTNLRPLLGALPVNDTSNLKVRRILMFEGTDGFGRLQTMLGTVDPVGRLQGTLTFADPITEQPTAGSPEIWEFYNTTIDAHPIHMHLVDFRVLDRQAFTGALTPKVNSDGSNGAILEPISISRVGAAVAPGAWESGKKDTVKAFPGQVTRVLVNFKRPGEYVYHCHILSHEDHEMMRSYQVL